MPDNAFIIGCGKLLFCTMFAVIWAAVLGRVVKARSPHRREWLAAFACSLVLFAYYVWPTPWCEWATHSFDYRTNRRTGGIEVEIGSEWTPLPGATEAALRESDNLEFTK